MVGASLLWGFCECFTHGWGYLGLNLRPASTAWLGNEGAKMSKDSKETTPSTIVENKKIQLTEEELKKVSGGSLSRECAGGKHFEKVILSL
jgi:hypothetical protein